MLREHLAINLKQLRRERGWTQETAAGLELEPAALLRGPERGADSDAEI